MMPTIEIIAQIIWASVAVAFIYRGYSANKKEKLISFREIFSSKLPIRYDDAFIAGGFISGIVLLILLVHKILTCGIICGNLLP